MPIKVSCPACGSRFSLGDDLYRRRVVGSLVKVKCRHCSAEIAVDATEPATMPSHEAPRKHPIPPRPKAITQIGLGTPPPQAALATASPLPLDLATPALPLNATITPRPVDINAPAASASVDSDSLWADEETIAINLSKTKSPPKPTPLRTLPVAEQSEELEQIEAEEIPVSSSGAPTLDALTVEAGGAHVPHGRPPPDEFLVSFGAGSESELSAPTIDVTSFASELEPVRTGATLQDATLDDDEPEYRPAHVTVPLFDMNGVLPSPNAAASRGSAAAAPVPPRNQPRIESFSEDRPRERKYVIPPEAATLSALTPKTRRSRAPLWIGLLAAAGAVGAGFGYREHRMKRSLAQEASLLSEARPVPSPVVNTLSALPAEGPPTQATEPTLPAPPADAVAAETPPVAPVAQTVAVGTSRSVPPNSAAAVKSSAGADASSTVSQKLTSAAEPDAEKPTVGEKSLEAHNAPPPAAPDTEFDRAAARNALASAATQASSCRKQGDPSGTANLTITFAPSGRVTSAQIQGPPFSGTATGGCIASTMRRASVPAFSGDYVTVSKTIVVQ